MTREVNIPLLRKAVEWAEAEAMKPPELCKWEQNHYSIDPKRAKNGVTRVVFKEGRETEISIQKSEGCGTCYCIAGYAAEMSGLTPNAGNGAKALGLSYDDSRVLFHYANTIEDVRRIAEEIAGERL